MGNEYWHWLVFTKPVANSVASNFCTTKMRLQLHLNCTLCCKNIDSRGIRVQRDHVSTLFPVEIQIYIKRGSGKKAYNDMVNANGSTDNIKYMKTRLHDRVFGSNICKAQGYSLVLFDEAKFQDWQYKLSECNKKGITKLDKHRYSI